MTYRNHQIKFAGLLVRIEAAGKYLEAAASVEEAQRLIDRRFAAFPNKPLGWW
jgi:hypothetical protein